MFQVLLEKSKNKWVRTHFNDSWKKRKYLYMYFAAIAILFLRIVTWIFFQYKLKNGVIME